VNRAAEVILVLLAVVIALPTIAHIAQVTIVPLVLLLAVFTIVGWRQS
jgi:hypothetical protein